MEVVRCQPYYYVINLLFKGSPETDLEMRFMYKRLRRERKGNKEAGQGRSGSEVKGRSGPKSSKISEWASANPTGDL